MSIIRWLITIAWMALIFYLSSIPNLELSGDFSVYDFVLRKLAHIVEYAVLFMLLVWSTNHPKLKMMLILLAVTILYAVSDEFHQSLVPTRDGKITDVLIDSIGPVISLGIILLWRKYRTTSTTPKI